MKLVSKFALALSLFAVTAAPAFAQSDEKPKKEKKKLEEEVILVGSDCTLCDLADKENAQIDIDIIHKSGRLWNRKMRFNEYISKVFNGFEVKKSNNKKSK